MKKIMIFFLLFSLAITSIAQEIKTLVLQPGPQDGFDAYINSAYPNEPGPDKGLLVNAWTMAGDPYSGKSLLRFDLSQLLPGDRIIDARLSLFFDTMGSWPEHYGDNQAHIRKITESWDFQTVTWNNQPSVTESEKVLLPQSIEPHQDYTNIDILNFVEDWVTHQEQNFGIMVSLDTNIPYACLVFAPSERTNVEVRPKLVITYKSCDVPIAGFSTFIVDRSVTFQDTSISSTSWYWNFGDGNYSSIQHPVHVYSEYGIYQVCLTIQDTCGADTICKSVNVCVSADPHFNYLFIDSLTVSFRDSSFMPVTWWWDFGNGNFSDQQNPTHHFYQAGTYYVCETVTNACDTQTYCDSVIINPLGIQALNEKNDVYIYPNPAKDFINIILNINKNEQ